MEHDLAHSTTYSIHVFIWLNTHDDCMYTISCHMPMPVPILNMVRIGMFSNTSVH